MAREYVERLAKLIEQVRLKRDSGKTIEVKHFFGGAAGYVDGRIFMSLTKVGLALKLPENVRQRLLQSGDAKELQYFPRAPVKKQYALMSGEYLEDHKKAKPWIEKSLAFALSVGG